MIVHLILVRFLLSSHLYVNDRNNIDINAFLLIWLRHNFTFYLFFVVQLLISGSVDGFDVDDLRSHTNYSGGYHRVSSSGFISDHILSTFWLCISCLEILSQRFSWVFQPLSLCISSSPLVDSATWSWCVLPFFDHIHAIPFWYYRGVGLHIRVKIVTMLPNSVS